MLKRDKKIYIKYINSPSLFSFITVIFFLAYKYSFIIDHIYTGKINMIHKYIKRAGARKTSVYASGQMR